MPDITEPRDIERLVAELSRQLSEAKKTLDEIVAKTFKNHKPKSVKLVDPRTGERLL